MVIRRPCGGDGRELAQASAWPWSRSPRTGCESLVRLRSQRRVRQWIGLQNGPVDYVLGT